MHLDRARIPKGSVGGPSAGLVPPSCGVVRDTADMIVASVPRGLRLTLSSRRSELLFLSHIIAHYFHGNSNFYSDH